MTTSENQEPVPRLPTVLIVDDDRVNRAALAEALQSDCRLLLAKDGEGALQRLRGRRCQSGSSRHFHAGHGWL